MNKKSVSERMKREADFWKRMSQRLAVIKQAGKEICEKGILEEA